MNVFLHNFNPGSNSGPNKFCRQLFETLVKDYNVKIVTQQNDADIEFVSINLQFEPVKPVVIRLDGIYFNSDQDYKTQNIPIKNSYDLANCVIFQTEFDKSLIESWFGQKEKNSFVIHNGPHEELINKAVQIGGIDENTEVWCCASSWRPHKRLEENLRYFYEKAPEGAIMIIAGANPSKSVIDEFREKTKNRVFYAGELSYNDLISLYKRSTTFVHLSYLDHCPNVVVDAQYAGCHIVCSSTGGTSEVVNDATVIQEAVWDFGPTRLYEPPSMDFSNYYIVKTDKKKSLKEVAKDYYEAFQVLL